MGLSMCISCEIKYANGNFREFFFGAGGLEFSKKEFPVALAVA